VRARDNPFATRRVLAVRYRPACGWDEILARCAALSFRGAVVGPEGAGKTNLLEDLAGRLGDRGFRVRHARLVRGERRLSPERERLLLSALGPRDLLILDGVDELSPLARCRLLVRSRAAGGLLVASHRAGLLPTLYLCATTPALLREIVRDLLADAGPEIPALSDLEDLYRRHAGNLRSALREMYDVCAAS